MSSQPDLHSPGDPVGGIAAPIAARVTVAVAPLVGEPRAAATQTSQYLSGARLAVLEARGDWFRVRGPDAYEGWMHRGYVIDTEAAGGDDDRIALGCVVRSAGGRTRALPLGALLDLDEEVVDGEAIRRSELPTWFPTDGAAIAASAQRFFEGTSYLWGGVTPWGADCSGLVQSVFALHGIALPRDAADQARCGIDVPPSAASLAPADLLFFSDREDGRITHVAIALGDGRAVHLALGRGGYAIEMLDGAGDPYVVALRTRVRHARRVIDS